MRGDHANSPDQADEAEGALTLDRAISAVHKRLKLVVALPITAVILASAVLFAIPNRYDASAVVQIDPRQRSITNLDSVVSDLKGDQPTIESEVEIIRSRPVILKVIETLDLRHDPEFAAPALSSRLMRFLGLSTSSLPTDPIDEPAPQPVDQRDDLIHLDVPGSSKPGRDEVAATVFDRLKISRVRNTLLIDIKFSSSDAIKAAHIANTVAEVYLTEQLQSKTGAAASATRLLEQKLNEMRTKVSDAERKVEQWKALNGVFDTEGQVLSEKQLARLMEQTVNARNTTSEAKAKFDQAQKLARQGDHGDALVEVLESHTVRLLKEQLANATRRAAELASKYGPRHPEIIKSRAEVADAERQVRGEIDRLVSNLKNEAEVAEARERQLSQSLSQLKEQQIISKDSGVDLNDLQREAATSKQLFEALLARYKQTAETQGFQLPDARMVEQAVVPLFPAAPKRKQLAFMAAVAGLILAIGLALLLEVMAPGIARSEDIARTLDLDHLSSVPAMAATETAAAPGKAVRLIVAEPSSIYADAIRNVRRELDQRRNYAGPRIILVTSSMPGEGADIIASNLAHHISMTSGSSLLVDGDLRLQPLTRQLAADRQRGLLDQLASGEPFEAAILRDGLTGLHFLPATGPAPSQISIPEALSSRLMASGLRSLTARFDTIIISAPPLLPVIDARILADLADQIVFVMTWQRTPKQIAKKALNLLGANQHKIAGVILNDVAEDQLEDYGALATLLGRSPRTAAAQYRRREAA